MSRMTHTYVEKCEAHFISEFAAGVPETCPSLEYHKQLPQAEDPL